MHLTENYANTWGYVLVRQGQLTQALELFKLNVGLYPRAWTTYDSLAETYESLGNQQLVAENYRQSLVLNPHNTNAADHLARLGAAMKH